MKIHLKKAFEFVQLSFIKELLRDSQNIFIKWIMACLTITNFTITLNGGPVGHFIGGRGLKQGDPLSPLVFVLTME